MGTQRECGAGARGAIDGREGTAGHAKARTVTLATLTPLLAQLAQRREGERQAREGHAPHEEAGPPGGAGAAPHLARPAPESRAMRRGQGGGRAMGAHGQTAVDRQPKRLGGPAVPNAPS